MTVTAGVFPTLLTALMSKDMNLAASGDTINVGLIGSGSYYLPVEPSTTAAMLADTTWTTIKANGSNALTEVSGTGYTAGGLGLTAADQAVSQSTIYVSLTYSGTIQWTSATFTAYQAVFYDDTYNQGICWWDFGGAQSCSSGTFTLTLGSANSVSNCILQFTATA